ncbi:DUF4258 domain-containing protein [Oxynema sp. CENA135]|uniref:DUF4258 domain-containing protein n=1 Tax=Oxynema sp. CENA135 TaxID=984206 RepID=UPI001F2AD3A9|nr:DUF4258 domain-containing protein [Oxynema sp. CENA135]
MLLAGQQLSIRSHVRPQIIVTEIVESGILKIYNNFEEPLEMDANKKLTRLLERDSNCQAIGTISAVQRRKDRNHLERRQQQRAISNEMIKVALLYGKKGFSRGATVFTLNDRILAKTPYAKFIDLLRGLRVVCLDGPPDPKILTAYWHEATKRRGHKVKVYH